MNRFLTLFIVMIAIVSTTLSIGGCTLRDAPRSSLEGSYDWEDSYVVRGQWIIKMNVGPERQLVNFSREGVYFASEQAPITASVSPDVRFTVSTDNFVTPIDPSEGEESYGTLDITKLRDNNLRVCGSGSDKCTSAAIRIYSKGTPGEGLWNALEGYGIPILTDSNLVGLDAAGSYILSTVDDLSKTRVLKLNHFTGDNSDLLIPVSVDFTEAAAGNYSSTLVVEYVLQ